MIHLLHYNDFPPPKHAILLNIHNIAGKYMEMLLMQQKIYVTQPGEGGVSSSNQG
jgi:hypothetical protein